MEILRGYVDHVIFRNAQNGYTVFVLSSEGEKVTCVGTFADMTDGMNLEMSGSYTQHASYGRQFVVRSYAECAPQDDLSVERYLASGAIKGIGPALASRIVRRFGADTFRVIEEEPERLAEVKGISQNKALEIADQANEKRDMRQAMIFLQQYGIGLSLAVKIYHHYGSEIYRILKENPYQMADELEGVGFRTADEIAMRAGIRADSDYRIKSGILYTLLSAAADGHTYLPQEQLSKRCCELLHVSTAAVEVHYMNLAVERRVVLRRKEEMTQIYAASYFYKEARVAAHLLQLDASYDVTEEEVQKPICRMEEELGLSLEDRQKEAVAVAAQNGILLLTGGPGTGKTTTINAIIRYFETEGMQIALAAPTGRAARRMTETTGREAKTIHRLLELNGEAEEHANFERNEDHPLEEDVIIVDEMSMVDINLMDSLLLAVPGGTRLVLVGDANQLPSVGPGSVLSDLIACGRFHTVRLQKIFRQAGRSDIVLNAHRINRGEHVPIDNQSRDFFFLKRYDADKIINVTLQLILEKLPGYVGAPMYDIQVLTPTRKGLLGVERLNGILQYYLNPPDPSKAEHEAGGRTFREGDKVIQTRNDYQMEWTVSDAYGIPIEKGSGIFNGDIGVIDAIHEFTETMTISFDEGRQVEYPFRQLQDLEAAYALTIHKAQGSEYPAVVIPLLGGPRMLLNRNLLYTAVTRAKSCVTIVGDDQTFYDMIDNNAQQKRYSGLIDRLSEETI